MNMNRQKFHFGIVDRSTATYWNRLHCLVDIIFFLRYAQKAYMRLSLVANKFRLAILFLMNWSCISFNCATNCPSECNLWPNTHRRSIPEKYLWYLCGRKIHKEMNSIPSDGNWLVGCWRNWIYVANKLNEKNVSHRILPNVYNQFLKILNECKWFQCQMSFQYFRDEPHVSSPSVTCHMQIEFCASRIVFRRFGFWIFLITNWETPDEKCYCLILFAYLPSSTAIRITLVFEIRNILHHPFVYLT